MPFEDVYLVSDKLQPASPTDVEKFEAWLRERFRLPLPRGYREYISTFGAGEYCDHVYVFPPNKITTDFKPLGQLWDPDAYFWPAGAHILSPQQAEQAIVIGRTLGGDEIVCSSDFGDELFILPRHDDHIYRMPQGLFDPLDWSGVPAEARLPPPPFRYFETFIDRESIHFFTDRTDSDREAIARILLNRLRHAEVREMRPLDHCQIILAKAIGGHIELSTEQHGHGRVSLRLRYDQDHQREVGEIRQFLVAQGFM